jgi:hypothetical protein
MMPSFSSHLQCVPAHCLLFHFYLMQLKFNVLHGTEKSSFSRTSISVYNYYSNIAHKTNYVASVTINRTRRNRLIFNL